MYLKMVDKARGLTVGQVKAAFFQVVSGCDPGRKWPDSRTSAHMQGFYL